MPSGGVSSPYGATRSGPVFARNPRYLLGWEPIFGAISWCSALQVQAPLLTLLKPAETRGSSEALQYITTPDNYIRRMIAVMDTEPDTRNTSHSLVTRLRAESLRASYYQTGLDPLLDAAADALEQERKVSDAALAEVDAREEARATIERFFSSMTVDEADAPSWSQAQDLMEAIDAAGLTVIKTRRHTHG